MRKEFTWDQVQDIAYGVAVADDPVPSVVAIRDILVDGSIPTHVEFRFDDPSYPYVNVWFEYTDAIPEYYQGYMDDFEIPELEPHLVELTKDGELWKIWGTDYLLPILECVVNDEKDHEHYDDVKLAFDIIKGE